MHAALMENVARQVLAHRATRHHLETLCEPLAQLLANDGVDRTRTVNGSRLAAQSASAVTGYRISNDWTPELQVCAELFLDKGGAGLRLAAYDKGVHAAHPDRFLTELPAVKPQAQTVLYQLQLSWSSTPDAFASEILRSLPLMTEAARRRIPERGALFMEQLYELATP